MEDFGIVRIYYNGVQKTDRFLVEDSKVFDTLDTLLTNYLKLVDEQFHGKLNIDYRVDIKEDIFTILVFYGDSCIDSFGVRINKFITPDVIRGITKAVSYEHALRYVNQCIHIIKDIGKANPILEIDDDYVEEVLAHIGPKQAASTLDSVIKESDSK